MLSKLVVRAYDIEWLTVTKRKLPTRIKIDWIDLCDVEDAIHNSEDVNELMTDKICEYIDDKYPGLCENFKWCFI